MNRAVVACLWTLLALGALASELRFSVRSEPRTFDPLLVDDSSSETIRYLTGGPLIRLDRSTQKPVAALAASWRVTEAGRRIDFELRPGVVFSDGTAFTADDVIYTMKRLLNPTTHSPLADSFPTGGKPVEMRGVGPHGVMIRFPNPIADLASLFDQVAIQSRTKPDAVLGPFVLSEHKPGISILLVRNSHFWKKDPIGKQLPYLDSVRVSIQPNREAEALALERGEIDFIQNIDPEIYDRLSKNPDRLEVFNDAGASLDSEQLWFNQVPSAPLSSTKKAWYADSHFRRAVSYALRREDLCKLVYRGHAVPAYGPVSPSNRYWFSAAGPPPSLDDALKELKAGGFKRSGDTLMDGSGTRVEFSIISNAGSKIHERTLALIQQDLTRLGIKVNLVMLDFSSLIERITRTFDYDACLMSLTNVGLDPNEQMNVWVSAAENHQWNPSQKSPANPWEAEIDKLMLAQSASPEMKDRKAAFDRVQQIVREQQPFIYLVHPNALTAVSRRLRGAAPAMLRPQVYWNVELLSLSN
jgi:peptide/nickel transport system substrate-binding protein